ncbi:MAG: DNA recombination protein RmuC [Bacteroidetes bacterium]|nr:DNA recombination protein RmuC [Bacteroidota bacterium]
MQILLLIIGLVVGVLIGWLLAKFKQTPDLSNGELLDLTRDLATQTALNKGLEEKLKTQKEEVDTLQKTFTTEFENLANKILEDKSKKFTEQNKTNLENILNPLKENIAKFEKKVDNTYKAEASERNSLKGEIKALVTLNKQISEEANNLAKALKGDSKKQGNWGEIILEKVLERSGLQKGLEYEMQVSITTEDGKRVQPDAIINFPDKKHIIIDAKVSLVAYEAFVNASDEEDRETNLAAHVISVKNHIKGLSEKNYQGLGQLNTPDFVLLFIPIESSFSLAVQADNELFNYAWERKIVIVSPSTLLATLRTISSIWKQERQTRNALEIAKQSGDLYDKFVGFVEDLLSIGKKMNDAKSSYDDAMKKLSSGKGNLVRRAETIKELGAKTTKDISQSLLERAKENE